MSSGIFESHTNFFVAAESAEDARRRAKAAEIFRGRKMHVDGIQLVEAVDGFRVNLVADTALGGASRTEAFHFRDLAPAAPAKQ
ncbi:MAG: DUF1543 domain-containing protein [Phycisphaerales bacterium]|nr:DUF1543 domain-containing protein [Phycisphaerales bacterium]